MRQPDARHFSLHALLGDPSRILPQNQKPHVFILHPGRGRDASGSGERSGQFPLFGKIRQ